MTPKPTYDGLKPSADPAEASKQRLGAVYDMLQAAKFLRRLQDAHPSLFNGVDDRLAIRSIAGTVYDMMQREDPCES